MFKTYEEIKNSILSDVTSDKREGSFAGDMVSPVALEIEAAHEQMKGILSKRFLVDETGEDLDKRADEYGLKRKPGTKATGVIVVSGVNGSVVPMGSLFGTIAGLLYEAKVEAVIIDLSATVEVEALDIGDLYNVVPEKITEIPIEIPGIASCTNTSDITGGSSIEKDVDLQNRVLLRIRNPSTSGNVAHYKEWALEVPGIGDAHVIPLKDGNGTVSVIPVTNDKRVPSESVRDQVAVNIDLKRPIGPVITVLAADEVPINVVAQIDYDPNYSLATIIENYRIKFTDYIKTSVFKLALVDYFKCLSLFYELSGVLQVTDFTINGGTLNIPIAETEIQVVGTLNIS